jgi:hypothetical protein
MVAEKATKAGTSIDQAQLPSRPACLPLFLLTTRTLEEVDFFSAIYFF